jgi:hypothetical protein
LHATEPTAARAPSQSLHTSEPRLEVACINGVVTVSVAANGWHPNELAPWKWDAGRRVAVDERLARFLGAACTGTIKAFVCDDSVCKGPISVAVR